MCEHHHDHKCCGEHDKKDNSGEKKRYWKILWIGIVIFIFQVVGGTVSNGHSLLADSAHVAVDILNIALSLIVVYMAVGSLLKQKIVRQTGKIIGISLLLLTVYHIALDSIERYENPQETIGWLMFIVALIGGIGNYYMAKLLHNAPEDEKNITNKVTFWHVMVDLVSSVIVVLSGAAIWITGCRTIDPILSFSLCLIITVGAVVTLVTSNEDATHSCGHRH